MEKVAILSRVGDYLDIRTGKQEFVEENLVWDEGQIAENIVWSSLTQTLFSGGDTNTKLLAHFLKCSRDCLFFFLFYICLQDL